MSKFDVYFSIILLSKFALLVMGWPLMAAGVLNLAIMGACPAAGPFTWDPMR